jgi:ribonuclease P protein component
VFWIFAVRIVHETLSVCVQGISCYSENGTRVKQGGWTERTCCTGEGGERFPRRQRLRSAQDFQRVRRRGRRISGAHLTLQYARRIHGSAGEPVRENDELGPLPVRIGFSVSKRVGSAVTRNLVKRRLREAVRRRLAALASGWDLVLTALPSASGVDYATLGAELDDLFTRAGVWLTTHSTRGSI